MSLSETEICNMALSRVGAKRITNIETDEQLEGILCRTHYEQTLDALLRAHWWNFAAARATLSEDAETPDFEWDHQYILPTDFLALRAVYEDNDESDHASTYTYVIEGDRILTDEDTCKIRYTKKVTNVGEFDPLFTEVLTLSLALKIVMPISHDRLLYREILMELQNLMGRVRAMDQQEANTIGKNDVPNWINSRSTGV